MVPIGCRSNESNPMNRRTIGMDSAGGIQRYKGVMELSQEKQAKQKQCGSKKQAEKTATNNQWTSASVKNTSDHRDRRDGPGGDCGCGR